MPVVADRFSLRWYLGYDLTESLPDHSSLTRIRERYGLAVFRRFFERIVEQCIAAGLVWGQEPYIDATKVAANAALDSLPPRFAAEAHLNRLFAPGHDEGDGDDHRGRPDKTGGDNPPTPLPIDLTEESRSQLAERAAQRHDWTGHAGRPDRETTSGTYRRTADFRLSTTDPDATPMPYGERGTRLGDQDHSLVDGGRARIILAALVAPAEVQENQPALDLGRWLALFGDGFAAEMVPALGFGSGAELRAFLASPPGPRPPTERARLLAVTDAAVMANGWVGALLVYDDPTQPPDGVEAEFALFDREGGRWTIVGIFDFTDAWAAAAGTPAP